MSENTALWDILGRTDPAHTKGFSRSGGFKGTAIKPIWSFRRMTEEFGACGMGWGIGEPAFQVVPGPEGEQLVFCTTWVWFKRGSEASERVYGVGGDKAVGKNKYGLNSDDEAFKKAFTDAITNALKLIGVGADVHMGLFEDNKYVAEMKAEFSEEPSRTPNTVTGKPASSAALKRNGEWDEFMRDLAQCETVGQVKGLYKVVKSSGRWTDKWLDEANEAGLQRIKEIEANTPDEPEPEVFPGDRPSQAPNNGYATARQ